MKKHSIKNLLFTLAFLLCMIGLAGWGMAITCEILSICGVHFVSSRLLLPLSNLNYDVSEDEKICCYLGTYHRIQLYDNKGHLLRGWFIKAHRNGEIYIDNDKIYLADYGDNYFVFDLTGEEIESRRRAGGLSELKSNKERKDEVADNYKSKTTMWDATIAKRVNEQEWITIIKTPMFLLPLRLLTPNTFVCIVGAVIMYLVRKDVRVVPEEKREEDQVSAD